MDGKKIVKNWYQNNLKKLDEILDYKDLDPIDSIKFLGIAKTQNKFHFVPSMLITPHYKKQLYKLSLHNFEVKKTNQNYFINFIDDDSWIKEYFEYIEKLIELSGYETIIKEYSKNYLTETSSFLSKDMKLLKAFAFHTFRARQFSNDEDYFGNLIDNTPKVKIKKYKDNISMQIEYVLRALMWFGQYEKIDEFINTLKYKLSMLNSFDEEGEFLIHQTLEENWKNQYNYIKALYESFGEEYVLITSAPNLKKGISKRFPLLQEAIGEWNLKYRKKFIPSKMRDSKILYLQHDYRRFSFIFSKSSLDEDLMAIESYLFNEHEIKLVEPIASIGTFFRIMFYYEDKKLKDLFGEKETLEEFMKHTSRRSSPMMFHFKEKNGEPDQEILEKIKLV